MQAFSGGDILMIAVGKVWKIWHGTRWRKVL